VTEYQANAYCAHNSNSQHSYSYFQEQLTPRKLLQLIGTECGRNVVHPNIWINSLFSDYKESLSDGWVPTYNNPDNHNLDIEAEPIEPNWIITDVRFKNEADAILERGGLVFRVNRPSDSDKDEHESETALDNYEEFSGFINNNGTIEDLIESVRFLFEKHNIIEKQIT